MKAALGYFFETEKAGIIRRAFGWALDECESLQHIYFAEMASLPSFRGFRQKIIDLFFLKISGESGFRLFFEKLVDSGEFREVLQDIFYNILKEELFKKEIVNIFREEYADEYPAPQNRDCE